MAAESGNKQARYRGHWLPKFRLRGRSVHICLWEPPYWRWPHRKTMPHRPSVEQPLIFNWYLFGPVEIRHFTRRATENAAALDAQFMAQAEAQR